MTFRAASPSSFSSPLCNSRVILGDSKDFGDRPGWPRRVGVLANERALELRSIVRGRFELRVQRPLASSVGVRIVHRGACS
jgi:hypothetical protein